MSALRVIAAAIVHEGRLLLVSKRSAPGTFYLPGGKPAAGESLQACLHRELREELGVGAHAVHHFTDVHCRAALEPVEMHMTVYRAELRQAPRAAAEIAAIVWWPTATAITVAPAVRDQVVPLLQVFGALRPDAPHA
jgi:8-oxo-dGTP diphosphatase